MYHEHGLSCAANRFPVVLLNMYRCFRRQNEPLVVLLDCSEPRGGSSFKNTTHDIQSELELWFVYAQKQVMNALNTQAHAGSVKWIFFCLALGSPKRSQRWPTSIGVRVRCGLARLLLGPDG